MAGTLSSISSLVRGLVSLVLLGVVSVGSWTAYQVYQSRAEMERQLAEKTAEAERLANEVQKLNLALRLLKVDHRVAQIVVLDQDKTDGKLSTRFQFVELTKDG